MGGKRYRWTPEDDEVLIFNCYYLAKTGMSNRAIASRIKDVFFSNTGTPTIAAVLSRVIAVVGLIRGQESMETPPQLKYIYQKLMSDMNDTRYHYKVSGESPPLPPAGKDAKIDEPDDLPWGTKLLVLVMVFLVILLFSIILVDVIR